MYIWYTAPSGKINYLVFTMKWDFINFHSFGTTKNSLTHPNYAGKHFQEVLNKNKRLKRIGRTLATNRETCSSVVCLILEKSISHFHLITHLLKMIIVLNGVLLRLHCLDNRAQQATHTGSKSV